MKKNIINISLKGHNTISDGYLRHSNLLPKRAIDFRHSLHFKHSLFFAELIFQWEFIGLGSFCNTVNRIYKL